MLRSLGRVAALLVALSTLFICPVRLSASDVITAKFTVDDKSPWVLVAAKVTRYYKDRGVGVNIGWLAVERDWALADWQTVDRRKHGQALLVHRCDSWDVRETIKGRKMTAAILTSFDVPGPQAARLVADLAKLERKGLAYGPYPSAKDGC